MSAPANTVKKPHPGNLLFRSRIEICRILQLLVQERSTVSATIRMVHPFVSRLLALDPETGHFVIAYCPHKAINSMLLESPSVEFMATDHQNLYFTFEATDPEEVQFEEQPAIQFVLPKSLLMHNRREHPRLPLPAEVSLRCIADAASVMPFESHITDVSHDGLGCIVYDPDINLEAGSSLKGCRIIVPDGDAVVADLELRYIAMTELSDGTPAHRAGFRFTQKPNDLAKLVDLFIQDLDKRPG